MPVVTHRKKKMPHHATQRTHTHTHTSTRILMKIRLEEVVASSLRRIVSRHVHGRASVYSRWAKNLATLRSLLVSSLRKERTREGDWLVGFAESRRRGKKGGEQRGKYGMQGVGRGRREDDEHHPPREKHCMYRVSTYQKRKRASDASAAAALARTLLRRRRRRVYHITNID